MLYGTSDTEPQTDIIVAQLAQELYNSNLLLMLIQNLNRIDFEVMICCLNISIMWLLPNVVLLTGDSYFAICLE